MSRTILIVLITAAIVVLFVISRYTSYDFENKSKGISKPVSAKEDAQFASWIPFTSNNKSFTVKVPREPEHVSQSTPDIFNRYLKHYEIYAINGIDNTTYLIQEITFSKGLSPEKDPEILQNSLNDILTTSGSTLVASNENATFLGNKGLSFVLDNDQKETNGLLFVKGKTLYIISRTVSKKYKNHNDEDYQYFLDSFQVKDLNSELPASGKS